MSRYPGNEIQGWMRPEELEWLYQTARGMDSIVEVGCWKGRSTHALLSGCPGIVTAVDNWTGRLFGLEAEQAEAEFRHNLRGFRNLKVMKMASLEAAAGFADRSVGMVFIDGCHDYEAVKADILAWWPKAVRLICGHDFSRSYLGVRQAVREIFGRDFEVFSTIWAHQIKKE